MKLDNITGIVEKHKTLCIATVILITFITHLSYINNGFTWLDHNDIEHKRAVVPIHQIPAAFLHRFGETGFYRPLVTTVHSIDSFLYNNWAPGFHITNLILHLAVTAVAGYFLAIFFRLHTGQRLIATLMVGIHPLSWIVVGSIPYRQESLLLIFTMLAVISHTKARKTGRPFFILSTGLYMFLALCSKETAVFFIPAFIAVWELRTHKPKKQFYLLTVMELTLLALYIGLRMKAVPDVWKAKPIALPLAEAIGTRIWLFDKFILELISPFLPSVSDAVPRIGITTFWALMGAVVSICVLFCIIKSGLRSKITTIILLFLIVLMPSLNIIPVPRIGSPHYAYHGVIMFAGAVIFILEYLKKRYYRLLSLSIIFLSVWILLAGSSTFIGGFQHKNDATFFQAEVHKDTHFAEGYYYLGNYYLAQQDYMKAAQNYEAALKPAPHYIAYVDSLSVKINLAGVRLMQEQYDQADTLYKQALVEAPASLMPFLIYNRALIAFDRGNYEETIRLLSSPNIKNKNPKIESLLNDALQRLSMSSP